MTTKSIVITVILVCAACSSRRSAAGTFYLTYRTADTDLSPKIDHIFAAINDGTLGEVYATETTPEFQEVMTRQQFEELGPHDQGQARAAQIQVDDAIQYPAVQCRHFCRRRL